MGKTKHALLAITLSLLFAAAGPAKSQTPGNLPSRQDAARFFPGEVPSGRISPWMTFAVRYLQLMREPALSDLIDSQSSQSYRVLVETHSKGVPIVVRMTVLADGNGALVTRVGQSGRNPDVLTQDRTTSVSKSEVDEFLSSLDTANFWSQPTVVTVSTDNKASLGYDNWILEGQKVSSFHLVSRNSAELASLGAPEIFLVVNLGKIDVDADAGGHRLLGLQFLI